MNFIVQNRYIYLIFESMKSINTILLVVSIILLFVGLRKNKEGKFAFKWVILAIISIIPGILYILFKIPNVFNYIYMFEIILISFQFIIRIIMIGYNIKILNK